MDDRCRLVHVQLDEKTMVRRRPEVEHERAVAIYDLLEENRFAPVGDYEGPFNLHLSASENRLMLDVRSQADDPLLAVPVSLTQFQSLVKEYFLICETYYKAIKRSSPSQIEAIDLGRRGLHNEGAQLLRDRLEGKIDIDKDTARRLFTLICILHIRG